MNNYRTDVFEDHMYVYIHAYILTKSSLSAAVMRESCALYHKPKEMEIQAVGWVVCGKMNF